MLLRFVLPALLGLVPVAGLRAQNTQYTPYTFSTLAGLAKSQGSVDATGTDARFYNPVGAAVDGAGNVYITDAGNNTIRKITAAGIVTTLAGTAGNAGAADGTGGAASFSNPRGVAVDGTGNVYVADTNNHTIRKITPAGVVTTFAGSAGTPGSSDGVGNAALFNAPRSVAFDGAGNLYVADYFNHTIRKITPAGVVTTFAGLAGSFGSADGSGSNARFFRPSGVAVDNVGQVYVVDRFNNIIRKITPTGDVTTFAGTVGVDSGSADGTGSEIRFNDPVGVAVDGAGYVYITDSENYTIRKISPTGVSLTLAGHAGRPGILDGLGTEARFNNPSGVAVDASGNIYVADTSNNKIRKITAGGEVTTFAGPVGYGSADGTGGAAQFFNPAAIALDAAGNAYVADSDNNTIRKITPAGVVTTLAGSAGITGSADGLGSAASFNFPQGVAVDSAGNVYVADSINDTIRKISPAGVVATLAGQIGTFSAADGPGDVAGFAMPQGIAVDSAGNIYVADSFFAIIRKVTPAGMVTTIAGTAGVYGSADGMGSAASFRYPSGVAVDLAGNVYVSDTYNYTIRKINPTGMVTTLAGTAGNLGAADGIGGAASFNKPGGLAVDNAGNVYVADCYNHTIRKINQAGMVTTIAGTPGDFGSFDGTGSAVLFHYPLGLAVDSAGNVYVADAGNDTIRKGAPVRAHDFNGDGSADIAWTDTTTGERAIWLMSGGTLSAGASLGTILTAWTISGTGDFDGDGKADILLTNTATGDRAMWLMNGTTIATNLYVSNVPMEWVVSAVGDFDGDGKADIFWTNTATGDRAVWLMNGNALSSAAYLGNVPVEWKVSGTGDFNGDGKADIVWTNTATGDRSIWLMNGLALSGGGSLGNIPTAWTISGVGDFDGDGKADILLSNTATGDRAMWLMNGTTISTNLYVGNVPVEWAVSAVGDFDGNGKADIFWSNTTTGDRATWLMNSNTLSAGFYLGAVPVEWKTAP